MAPIIDLNEYKIRRFHKECWNCGRTVDTYKTPFETFVCYPNGTHECVHPDAIEDRLINTDAQAVLDFRKINLG